jgi:hypothetical protein
MTSLDVEVRDNYQKFLKNVKGMAFYSVPHGDGSQEFSSFLALQRLQTNVINKKIEHGSKNLNSFNRQMEQLYVDFTKYIDENIYDLHELYVYEALPINDKQASLTSNCTINFTLLIGLRV